MLPAALFLVFVVAPTLWLRARAQRRWATYAAELAERRFRTVGGRQNDAVATLIGLKAESPPWLIRPSHGRAERLARDALHDLATDGVPTRPDPTPDGRLPKPGRGPGRIHRGPR